MEVPEGGMYLLPKGGRGSMLHTFQIRRLLRASRLPLQLALTPTSPHPSLCDPPPTTLLTRLAAWTAELPLCGGVPGAATVLSASLLHPGSLWLLLTLALEAPLPPPKDPGSSTPAPSAPAPLAPLWDEEAGPGARTRSDW